MLKLSIPYTILNAVSTSVMSIALGIKQQEETNTKLKASILKTDTKNAEAFNMKLEDYLKQKEEKKESYFKKLLKRISITDLIEINTKVFQVTKTEESVDITVNDQYIVDCVQSATNLTLRLLKPLADASVIMDEEVEKRWFDKPVKKEPEYVVVSKVVDESKVPSNISNAYKVEIRTDGAFTPFFIDSDKEKHIDVYGVTVTNELINKAYTVYNSEFLTILKADVDCNLKELAETVKLPVRAIKAIRAHYNQTPFTS